jgi:isoquinoline 1-oxidoreductase subunit alpha
MRFVINGQNYELDIPSDEKLVWLIRDTLGLTGTKYGCGLGICGSCTVHLEGQAIRSCITPVETVAEKEIITIEGLPSQYSPDADLHPIQQAFIDEQVPQCSWCMSGQMMTAAAFLARTPNPSEEEIIQAMSTNYCRCGCYVRIKSAVAKAADTMRGEEND